MFTSVLSLCYDLALLCVLCSVVFKYLTCSVQARTDLEQHSVEGASTGDSVTFITFVQSLKRKTKTWEKNVEVG